LISTRTFLFISLVWFWGWSFLLLRFPKASFRLLAWGRMPTAQQLKRTRIIGYLSIINGCLALAGVIFDALNAWAR
jgi:hypothetical protein